MHLWWVVVLWGGGGRTGYEVARALARVPKQLWSDGITFYAQHVMLECRVKRFQTQEYDHTKHFRGLELEGISRFDNNLSNPKFPQFP